MGTISFSVASSLMFLLDVTSNSIKWTLCTLSLVVGFTISLIYFFYFQKRNKLESAIVDLCESFKKDIETLLAAPSLKEINEKAKTVLLIDAVNLVRNVCLNTFLVGYPILRNHRSIIKIYCFMILEALKKLIEALGIDLTRLI